MPTWISVPRQGHQASDMFVACRNECSPELRGNHYHVPTASFPPRPPGTYQQFSWKGSRQENTMGLEASGGSGNKVSTPGVEPGLSRPRRDVLTTRRCGPCISCISFASGTSIQVRIACCNKLNLVANLVVFHSAPRQVLHSQWARAAQPGLVDG